MNLDDLLKNSIEIKDCKTYFALIEENLLNEEEQAKANDTSVSSTHLATTSVVIDLATTLFTALATIEPIADRLPLTISAIHKVLFKMASVKDWSRLPSKLAAAHYCFYFTMLVDSMQASDDYEKTVKNITTKIGIIAYKSLDENLAAFTGHVYGIRN